jgi:hypothetical protein
MDNYSSGYRFDSEFILNSIYSGVRLLFSIRPESRYNGVRLVSFSIPVVTAATLSTEQAKTLPLDPRWTDALIYFAAAKCYEIDSSDTANASLADSYFSKFNNLAKL